MGGKKSGVIKGVIKLGVFLTQRFQSEVPSSQGCHLFKDAPESGMSSSQMIVTDSGVSSSQRRCLVRGVSESGVFASQECLQDRCHLVMDVIEPKVLLSWGCISLASDCQPIKILKRGGSGCG
jgi:hypothetical protein